MDKLPPPISREERNRNLGYPIKPWEPLEAKIERVTETIIKAGILAKNPTISPEQWQNFTVTEKTVKCKRCNDNEYVYHDVPVEHQDFGKAFPCPDCRLPKLEQERREKEKARIEQIIKNAGMSKHHMIPFEDFWALPEQFRQGKERAAEACQIVANERQLIYEGIAKRGLLLYGNFGTGKTTLVTAAIMEVGKTGTPVMCIKHADLMDRVQSAYGAIQVYLRSAKRGETPPLAAEEIIQATERAEFLVIDDLGDPKLFGEISDDKRRITHRIFEYRNEHELPTLVTTNLNLEQITVQFSERTKQRITELCHFIEVTGHNLRA